MSNKDLVIGPLNIEREPHFDGLYIKISIEDFLSKGFNYGDSLNLSFSNGVELKDIPFYSAYYVGHDQPLVVAYQSNPYIDLTFNFTGRVMDRLNLNEKDTVVISLNEAKKNLLIEKTFAQKHSNDRNDYETDESFCNFREITNLNNPKSLIYRSATPCENDYNRAYHVSELCRKYNINYVIDLSNKQEEVDECYKQDDIDNEYWKYLYEQKRVIPLSLDVNYQSEKCAQRLVEILRFIINNDGPYLIHCSEGKDRTGYAAIVIKGILKHSLSEIEYDYMKTYDEYYHITKQTKPESYEAIKELYFDRMAKHVFGNDMNDLYSHTKEYLLKVGMSEEEINQLEEKFK